MTIKVQNLLNDTAKIEVLAFEHKFEQYRQLFHSFLFD